MAGNTHFVTTDTKESWGNLVGPQSVAVSGRRLPGWNFARGRVGRSEGEERVMQGSTSGLAARLFGSQNQIAIMDRLAEWTRLHLDARFASAQLYDHKRKRLHVVAQREFASGLLNQFGEIPITSGTVCARAARLQMPILIPDVTRDEDWIPFLSLSESAGFGGVLSIPLL